MQGYSIQEMADLLKEKYKTIQKRIERGEYAPIFDGKLYSEKVFKAVGDVRSPGRPKIK